MITVEEIRISLLIYLLVNYTIGILVLLATFIKMHLDGPDEEREETWADCIYHEVFEKNMFYQYILLMTAIGIGVLIAVIIDAIKMVLTDMLNNKNNNEEV